MNENSLPPQARQDPSRDLEVRRPTDLAVNSTNPLGEFVTAASQLTDSFTDQAKDYEAQKKEQAMALLAKLMPFFEQYKEDGYEDEDYSHWKTRNIALFVENVIGADGQPIEGGVTFEISNQVNKLLGNAIARANGIHVPAEEDEIASTPFDTPGERPKGFEVAQRVHCTIYPGEVYPDEDGTPNNDTYFGSVNLDEETEPIGMFHITMYANGTWTSRATDFTMPVEGISTVSLGNGKTMESPDYAIAVMKRYTGWLGQAEQLFQEDE